MAYLTQTELEEFIPQKDLIQLTDDAGAGSVDAGKVTDAIKKASSTIDAYAGARHSLPLKATEKVKQLAIDLTVYELEKRRRKIRDATRQAYEDAIAFLRDLANGKVTLDTEPATNPQVTEAEVKKSDPDDQTFSAKNLVDF